MKRTTEIVAKSVLLVILFVLLPFFNARAVEVNNAINEYDSMHRYNALENKISFNDFTNTENLPKESPDNIIKELQDITEKQNVSIENTENAINTLKNRNEIKTFFIGNNLGKLNFQLVQIRGLASLLDDLALKSQDSINTTQIKNQINTLKQEQVKVEDFIIEQKNKFSLFGWLVTSF